MARAENHHPLPNRQGEAEDTISQYGGPDGEMSACKGTHQRRTLLVQQSGGGALRPQHQPAGAGVFQPCQHRFRQPLPQGVAAGDKLEQHRDRAAAGHAQAVRTLRQVQTEVPQSGAVPGQQFHGGFFGAKLHPATADCAAEPPLRPYQHLAAHAPRGGACLCGDGHQNGIRPRRNAIKKLAHDRLHGVPPLCFHSIF